MLVWLRNLDSLLRGERTQVSLLSRGEFDLPLRMFVPLLIALGATYGFFMGWFSVAHAPEGAASGESGRWVQLVYAMIKVPALFLLTLLVTFPSLYVFNALVGTRLSFASTMRLLIAAIVVTLAIAASLGPIVAFFTLSTTSYPFMVMLNVVMLGLAGLIGLGFLLKTLRKMAVAAGVERSDLSGMEQAPAGTSGVTPAMTPVAPPEPAIGANGREQADSATLIFQVWVVIFGLVGAQMAWLLRPFIGSPNMPVEFLRSREGNFFQSVLEHLSRLTGL